MGKSLLTIDLIARLSRGDTLPDGKPAGPPRTSLILTTEDDPADTIVPRARAAGADLNRLVLPRFERTPRFPEDLWALEQLIREAGVELVVVDPLMAFLPRSVSANMDQYVREALTPLTDLAARLRCTILLIRHLTKRQHERAALRGQGSMGILAAVRTCLFAAPHPAESGLRVLSVAKSNAGRRAPSLGYRIASNPEGLPVVEWGGVIERTADQLCEKVEDPRVRPRDRAIDWLKRELANGPRKAAELHAAAAETGIPERTLRRAKEALPARAHRVHDYRRGTGEWYWFDPDAAWPKKAPFKKPGDGPSLDQL
jgi:RecA-family ATPase